MSAPGITKRAAETESGKRKRGWFWASIAVVLVAAVGITLLVVMSSGSDLPVLTYTGDELIYDGPTEFGDPLLSLKLENTSDRKYAQFARGEIPDHISKDEHDTWAAQNPYSEPPWLERWYRMELVGPGAVKEVKVLVSEGRFGFAVWNAEADPAATHVAGIFEATRN